MVRPFAISHVITLVQTRGRFVVTNQTAYITVAVRDDARIVAIGYLAGVATHQTTYIITVMRNDLQHIETMVQFATIDTDECGDITCPVGHYLSLRETQMMHHRRLGCFRKQTYARGKR